MSKLSQSDYRKAVEMAFNHFDKNKDQRLDLAEFKNVYAAISGQLNFELTDQILLFLFNQFSGKTNQPITVDQFYNGLQVFYFK